MTAIAGASHRTLPGLAPKDVPTGDRDLIAWVRRAARLAAPDRVVWCDGSDSGRDRLSAALVACDSSSPVATPREVVADGRGEVDALHEQVALSFEDCMRGRTMYVVPFATGTSAAECGLQLTDSACVAATLVGDAVPFSTLRAGDRPLKAVHSVGEPLALPRGRRHATAGRPLHSSGWVVRFPKQSETWSLGVEHEPRLAAAA